MKTNKSLLYLAFFILPIFYIDKAVLLWVKNFYTTNLSMHAIDEVLNPIMAVISNGATLMAASLLIYLFAGSFNKKLCEAGKSLLIGLLSAGVVVQILKHLFGRARPRVTFDPVFIGPSVRSGYDSFPSGHTTLAFCLAFILSRYYPRYRAVFYLFAVIVGLDRVDGLSHFPSDVLAGAIVGTVVAKLLSVKLFRPDPTVQLSQAGRV